MGNIEILRSPVKFYLHININTIFQKMGEHVYLSNISADFDFTFIFYFYAYHFIFHFNLMLTFVKH